MIEAQKAKAEKTLNTLVRYNEGVMSRRDWIKLQKQKGSEVKESLKSKTMYNRIKYNRMNHQEQEEYEKRLNTKVPCYELHMSEGGFYDITRAEFDYFNSLT